MTINVTRIALALILSIAVGGAAYARGSLTKSGWLGAVIVGTLTLGFGGWSWGLTLIGFFISSSALSHYKQQVKEQRTGEIFAKGAQRDLAQALANGGFGSVIAVFYALTGEPTILMALFVGVLATVTADTWATELGVLSSEQPRLVTTFQHVQPGTSGAITMMGTGASALGGLLMGILMFLFAGLEHAFYPQGMTFAALIWCIPAGLLGGLVGSLSDSLMAATIQARYRTPDGKETEKPVGKDGTPHTFSNGLPWLNNDMVNLLSTFAGGVVAVLCYVFFG
jgi:uncharacterized protein (TIGR00297 family)